MLTVTRKMLIVYAFFSYLEMTCFIEITFYEDLKKFLLIYSLIPCYLLFLKKKNNNNNK